jgi:serine/threonine protein kinase
MIGFTVDVSDDAGMGDYTSVGMFTTDDLAQLHQHIQEGHNDFDPCTFENVGSVLGRGASGCVRRMRNTESGTLYAVKCIRLGTATARMEVCREMLTNMLPERDGKQWLARYHGVFYDEGTVNIVMDLMSGSLSSLIGKRPSEPIAAKIAAMVLKGLRYLHDEAHLMHRDIKPSNVLFDAQGHFKLTDFGLTSKTSESDGSARQSTTFVGTVLYMAPERLKSTSGHASKSDIFSFGLSMAEVVTGVHPLQPLLGNAFYGSSEERFWGVMKVLVPLDPLAAGATSPLAGAIDILADVSDSFKDFLRRAVAEDENDRWTAAELLAHPWILNNNADATDDDCEPVRRFLETNGLLGSTVAVQPTS